MDLKKGWVLMKLTDDEYATVPTGESAETFSGLVRLNESGKDIWEGLADGLTEEEIAKKLLTLYDGIDMEKAMNAVKKVIAQLKDGGVLTDE